MILDDVFSGLDATSEERIFLRLLGRNGLLRQLGRTVILVTHAAHRLSYADHIIVLSFQGTISEQGKLEHLLMNNGYVARLAARHTEEAEDAPKEEPTVTKAMVDDDTTQRNAAADLNRPIGSWEIYSYYFSSIGWRYMTAWIGLMICYSVLLRFPGKLPPIATGAGAKYEKTSGSSSGQARLLLTATQ